MFEIVLCFIVQIKTLGCSDPNVVFVVTIQHIDMIVVQAVWVFISMDVAHEGFEARVVTIQTALTGTDP